MTRPVAIVTGAAQGIGLEVAQRLAATHRVALLDLNADALPDAAAACGDDALYRACDITHPEQVADAVAWVVDEAGGIDVLISNAGVAVGGALRHLDPDALAAALNVNLVGNWRVIHACLPHIEARRGYVMGVASAVRDRPRDRPRALRDEQGRPRDAARHPARRGGAPRRRRRRRLLPLDRDRHGRGRRPRHGGVQDDAQAMVGPLRTTHPVGDAAQAIVDGVHARSRTVFAPRWLRFLSPVRMVLRTRAGERDARAVAPELDRLTAERVAEIGAFDAALRDTVGVGGRGRVGRAPPARDRLRRPSGRPPRRGRRR